MDKTLKHETVIAKTGTAMSYSVDRSARRSADPQRHKEHLREVELKNIELTTPDIDFIKMWLESKNDTEVNQYIQNLMCQIVEKFERAKVKENLSMTRLQKTMSIIKRIFTIH